MDLLKIFDVEEGEIFTLTTYNMYKDSVTTHRIIKNNLEVYKKNSWCLCNDMNLRDIRKSTLKKIIKATL